MTSIVLNRRRLLAAGGSVIASSALLLPARAQGLANAWTLLRRPGHVVFIRHAATPGGSGDPPGYRLDDCASQRNLTDAGRDQARRTGEAFRARGLAFDRVLSSPW